MMMMMPVMISCEELSHARYDPPRRMVIMMAAPIRLPSGEPSPPERLAPPMTAAAMTSSSKPTATVGSPTVSRENCITPATPVNSPASR